jgi:hypothetical protein
MAPSEGIHRRRLLQWSAAGLSTPAAVEAAPKRNPTLTLLEIPIELAGDWRESAAADVRAVLAWMRLACLDDIGLCSDRQPEKLRVEDHASGPPHIWLHTDNPTTASIVVDVGARDWCKLAYQFGHELGHVLANSWTPDGRPHNPCQWLEEACVEAFALRGLGRLAASWRERPPFPNDGAYADSILNYRERTLAPDRNAALEQGAGAGLGAWFTAHREYLETHGTVEAARPLVPVLIQHFERDSSLVEALGAMNRWPQRTSLPLPDYLARWALSCKERGARGDLPSVLKAWLA